MSEITKEIKVIGVDYVCDKCGIGKMRPTGICLDSNPPQYPHECENCGHVINMWNVTYPTTRYEEINNETS